MQNLVLAELPYSSIQGEGSHVGKVMTFLRLQGCDVGCKWCDSYYTWSPYNQEQVNADVKGTTSPITLSVAQVVKLLEELGTKHVWITGGEPMLQAEAVKELVVHSMETDHDFVFHICTAGRLFDAEIGGLCNHVTIDVKAPTSGVKGYPDTLETWSAFSNVEFKMVVANNIQDQTFAKEIVSKFGHVQITLQPLYLSEPAIRQSGMPADTMVGWKSIAQFAEWVSAEFSKCPNVRMGLQLHKLIWPSRQRGI